MVKNLLFIIPVIIVVMGVGIFGYRWYWLHKDFSVPLGQIGVTISNDLEQYDFDMLKIRGGKIGTFELVGEAKEVDLRRKTIKTKVTWVSQVFRYQSEGKWISGMINYWPDGKQHPTVVMVRGYADKPGYYPGFGSWKMADELAKEKMNTVSLDFLGFAQSDPESTDGMEARFEKVPAVLDLLATVKTLSYVDPTKIGLWAHSNGGQIVLSVLEVSGEFYPTVLWAPMTDPFPQSLLDTNDSGEAGEPIRQLVAAFQKNYDARRYAFENYYAWIKAPVKIFQGTNDEWCKVVWQQNVVEALQKVGAKAELQVVEGDDHNFSKNWEVVAKATSSYFRSRI